MITPKRLLVWFSANCLVYFGLIALFMQWIAREVEEEYRLGYRTGPGGDSLGIPVFGFALILGAIVLVANLIFGLFLWSWRHMQFEDTHPGILTNESGDSTLSH